MISPKVKLKVIPAIGLVGPAGVVSMEVLQPMLQSWLDENLPAMVERLVRAEIERVG